MKCFCRNKRLKEGKTEKKKPVTLKNTESVISYIFLKYLEVVKRFGRFEVKNLHHIEPDTMIGFWHGDTYIVYLVLEKIMETQENVRAIVTSNPRGNYIEQTINFMGAKAIRLPDGMAMLPMFRALKEESREPGLILAASLDGPSGPVHEPKKLLFLLAKEAEKKVTYIRFESKWILRLKWRWDNYVIPLPFAKITAYIENLGSIDQNILKNFQEYRMQIKY